jgi:ribosome-associated toxin RatA of RatAB toxin-antitoxin module
LISIDRSALLHYTPEEMFKLVTDVEAYPEFLPWCSGAEILSQEDNGMIARIDFSVGNVSKSFTTRNVHRENEEVDITLVDGPFSELQGYWHFHPLGGEGCKINLSLVYDFSNRMVSMVVGPVFGNIVNSLVDSFQKRAVEVYGTR